MHCEHNIPETKKGHGPCVIRWEVKKRNGMPNWWCRTHGLEASAPDGAALDRCSASWFEPVSEEMRTDIDLDDGEFAVWGVVPPAFCIGEVPTEDGKVHIHYRAEASGKKQIDRSFDIVRVRKGKATEVVEGMAAQAHALTVLANENVSPLVCPRCGEGHIDELLFATRPHVKHLCNACGRNFRDRSPSISNPLEAPRIGGRSGPYGSGPWPERPVSEANKSGYDHPATRLAADQSALALRRGAGTPGATATSTRPTGQPSPLHHVERVPRSRHLAIQQRHHQHDVPP